MARNQWKSRQSLENSLFQGYIPLKSSSQHGYWLCCLGTQRTHIRQRPTTTANFAKLWIQINTWESTFWNYCRIAPHCMQYRQKNEVRIVLSKEINAKTLISSAVKCLRKKAAWKEEALKKSSLSYTPDLASIKVQYFL